MSGGRAPGRLALAVGRARLVTARAADRLVRPVLGARGWDALRRAVYALEEALARRATRGVPAADSAARAVIAPVDAARAAPFAAYLAAHGQDAGWLRRMQVERGAVALAAWLDDACLGHVLLVPRAALPDGRPAVQLMNLHVAPAWRGQGLGRRLLAAFREHARARGARAVRLSVNRGDGRAVAFYAGAGFRFVEGGPAPARPGRAVLEGDA